MPSYKYVVDFIANTRKFNSDIQSAGASLKNTMSGIAGAVGVGLSAAAIISFGRELVIVGGQLQGVRAAFNRIADDRVLEKLKEATAGTVSELELMKRAVSANNLGLPVENLASLFEFATKRAQETGESVDYLVNSIVTGIGRKSPLILDNLGITAVQLKEKLKGVGLETASTAEIAKAVGEIAADSMKSSGSVMETTAIQAQQLTATFEDLKTQFGETIAESQKVKTAMGDLVLMMKMLDEKNFGITSFLTGIAGGKSWGADKERFLNLMEQRTAISDVTADYEKMYKIAREGAGVTNAETKAIINQITTYGDLKQKIKNKNAELEKADVTDTQYIKTLYAEIAALEKQKKAFEAIAQPTGKRIAAPDKIPGLRGGENLGVSLSKDELKAFEEQNTRLDDMAERNNRVAESVQAMSESWQSYIEKMWLVAESHDYLNGGLTQLQAAGLAFAESMMQAATSANVNLENVGQTIKNVVADNIRAYIAEGVAGAVSKSLAFLPFPFNMAAGAAAAVGATSLFNSIIPAFADGGIIKGPTVGLMGEYPGASRNPEIVGKLSDLQKVMPINSGRDRIIIPTARLKKGDIYISYEEAKREAYKTT